MDIGICFAFKGAHLFALFLHFPAELLGLAAGAA
jgi:hypothetical protein